jgi:hypothetical protein
MNCKVESVMNDIMIYFIILLIFPRSKIKYFLVLLFGWISELNLYFKFYKNLYDCDKMRQNNCERGKL